MNSGRDDWIIAWKDSLFAVWRMNGKRASMGVGELIRRPLQRLRQILEAWTMVLALDMERSEWTESVDI